MATIIIEDVPDKVVESYWTKISYSKINDSFIPKKKRNVNITENGFTEEFEDQLLKDEKDPNNISYWPFTKEEFINELKKM